jgi:small GTP-binding protein
VQDSTSSTLRIALAGNPNVGKSSLFNALTGLRQKVGNFPGVTIEKKEGTLQLNNELKAKLIDLPGIYKLSAEAEDEQITTDYLQLSIPDLVIVVADATNLRRNLLLFSQIKESGIPVVLALNMMDLAQKNKQEIDFKLLAQLLQTSVIPVNGRIGKGLEPLKEAIVQTYSAAKKNTSPAFKSYSSEDTLQRYRELDTMLSKVLKNASPNLPSIDRSNKIDDVLLHPFYGHLIF